MPEREKRTVLFSDIRDFTSLTSDRGDREAYRLVRTFVKLVREQVLRQDGKVVKTYGDGVLNVFPGVEDGLQAAIGMQRDLRDYNEENPKDQISAGIGINWGEILRDEGDVFGHSVNLAARLAGLAKGGQILVSSFVKEEVPNSKKYEFLEPSYREIKGLGREKVSELLWRDELSRLSTNDGELNVVLTEDHLSIELSKDLQKEIRKVREDLSKEARNKSGFAGYVIKKVETYVDRYLPKILDRALAKKGIGLEHSIRDTRIKVSDEGVEFLFDEDKALTLSEEDINLSSARKFARKLRNLKSSS